ncbi:MAG: sugar ABC transporter permease, partial [Treponema sp.]|nr:sugar ABC transporter permease [Treponema sp.]
MSDKLKRLAAKKRLAFHDGIRKAKQLKFCYAFLAPFAILFITFTILPIVNSIYYSFTNFNILEKPEFIGVRNYINLFLQDEVNTIAIKNTFLMALFIGPVGYILSFVIAWLINELPKWLRAVFVFFFYAPSIAGGAISIFTILFRDDSQGLVNAFLIRTGIIATPLAFFTNPAIGMKIIIPICLWSSMGAGFLS